MSDVQLLDELGRLWKPSIVYGRNEIVWNTRMAVGDLNQGF